MWKGKIKIWKWLKIGILCKWTKAAHKLQSLLQQKLNQNDPFKTATILGHWKVSLQK